MNRPFKTNRMSLSQRLASHPVPVRSRTNWFWSADPCFQQKNKNANKKREQSQFQSHLDRIKIERLMIHM